MKLREVIKKFEDIYSDYNKIIFKFYGCVMDDYTGECLYTDIPLGIATYRNGVFDTSDDPSGWTLDEEVQSWDIYCQTEDEVAKKVYTLHIDTGRID